MIKVESIATYGWEAAIRGMRNPMNSWSKSDSAFVINCDKCELDCESVHFNHQFADNCCFCVGENDLDLMKRLYKGGTEHRKYLRMITVTMDITAPLYWWKEFDTYKVGTVANSCSTMHRLTHKHFEESDFSFEHLIGNEKKEYFDVDEDFEEVFEHVPGHITYSVSNKGRIYSHKRGKFLKPSVNSSNYKKVVLNGKNLYVHRLVAEMFCENPSDLCEVNHKDGNKWNNNYTNLEWVSTSENAQHAFDTGLRTISGYTRYKVSKSAHRFSDYEIEAIRAMYNDGMTKQEIADRFGCYSSVICNILNGNTYREVEMTPYDNAKLLIDALNDLRDLYLETKDKRYWWQMIQLLPSSYNQRRTVQMSYENVMAMIKQRENHKLDEWVEFVGILKDLPYVREITGKGEQV